MIRLTSPALLWISVSGPDVRWKMLTSAYPPKWLAWQGRGASGNWSACAAWGPEESPDYPLDSTPAPSAHTPFPEPGGAN